MALQFQALPPRPRPIKGGPESQTAGAATAKTLEVSANNLLQHIPGEATGFYLMSADALVHPTIGMLWMLFAMALVITVLVRWLAKASWQLLASTIGAFVIWMFILDKGVLHQMWPELLPHPMGLIVAVFYSIVITLLANAGKIR
jgi:hypothetical protein